MSSVAGLLICSECLLAHKNGYSPARNVNYGKNIISWLKFLFSVREQLRGGHGGKRRKGRKTANSHPGAQGAQSKI